MIEVNWINSLIKVEILAILPFGMLGADVDVVALGCGIQIPCRPRQWFLQLPKCSLLMVHK